MFKNVLKAVILSFMCSMIFYTKVSAEELEWYKMKATAYCLTGKTASGIETQNGICASKKEWIGKTAGIYINDNDTVGDFLGYYAIQDTGGEAIKKGHVIDIWMEKKEDCKQFGNPDVYVIILEDEQCQQVTE